MQDVLVRARNGVMCMLLIPALRRQRQVDLCEFLANLVYMLDVRSLGGYERMFPERPN
ncbi:mCG1044129, isoform CRA_b [Mus musculus]|nr:mCG1044129, isoform CRA_b [Mus musculus]